MPGPESPIASLVRALRQRLTRPWGGIVDSGDLRFSELWPTFAAAREAPSMAPSSKGEARADAPAQARQSRVQQSADALRATHARMKALLFAPEGEARFVEELRITAARLTEAALAYPDHMLYQLFRERPDRYAVYAVTHALQCAVACALVAQRLQWSAERSQSLVCAALTMNIGMARLQGEMAGQAGVPSNEQLQRIHAHPEFGAAQLRALGVRDPEWLRAVHEHHETPDATGYPRGIAAQCEAAEILRHVDIFLAKLKARASRKAIAPNLAILEIFVENSDSRLASAVIKEFGLYPPGMFVRLANGDLGVVVARGAAVNQPIVSVLVTALGELPVRPIRRDTQEARYAVAHLVDAAQVLVCVDPEKL